MPGGIVATHRRHGHQRKGPSVVREREREILFERYYIIVNLGADARRWQWWWREAPRRRTGGPLLHGPCTSTPAPSAPPPSSLDAAAGTRAPPAQQPLLAHLPFCTTSLVTVCATTFSCICPTNSQCAKRQMMPFQKCQLARGSGEAMDGKAKNMTHAHTVDLEFPVGPCVSNLCCQNRFAEHFV